MVCERGWGDGKSADYVVCCGADLRMLAGRDGVDSAASWVRGADREALGIATICATTILVKMLMRAWSLSAGCGLERER